MSLIQTARFIPDGLVGKWMIGDGHPNAQRGTIIDLSGRNHPGAIYGVPALYFDHRGSDKYVSPGTCFAWMQGHRYAVARFAVKPTATGGDQIFYDETGSSGTTLGFNTSDAGDFEVRADTTGAGGGNMRTALTGPILTFDVWNHVLVAVDATDDKLYVWVNGALAVDGVALSGALDHDTFQAGTPAAQRWGLSTGSGHPLEGYLCCMGLAGLDSLPTSADAQAIYDNPQGSLSGGNITWDAYYRCNEGTNPADNGEGTAARDLTTTTAAWDMGANLGNAWVNSGGAGDSFSAGARWFDATDDYVNIAAAASINDLAELTWVWWGTILVLESFHYFYNKGDWDNLARADATGKLRFSINTDGTDMNVEGAAGDVTANQIVCIAGVYSDSGAGGYVARRGYLFIDGAEIGTYGTRTDATGARITEGGDPLEINQASAVFNARQNYAFLYFNRALTAAEIKSLYDQGPYR